MKLSIYIAYILLILAASLMPGSGRENIPHLDKVWHFLTYALLSVLSGIFFKDRIWHLVLFGVTLGGSIEILQNFVPNRSASWLDLLANVCGTGCGTILYFILTRKKSDEQE